MADFPIPDIQTHGAAYKVSVQTDRRGAVLIAYTKDPESGQITRSLIRFDWSSVDYIKHRLGMKHRLGAES